MTVPPGGDNGKAEAPGPPVRPPVSAAVLLLYNAIYLIGFCLYLPLFLWKVLGDRSYRSGMRQRMGHVPVPPSFPVVWVHGVSVGEVKAAEPLVHALEQERPELSFVISSTTPTGYRVACRLYGEERVIYYPIDFGPFPGRALDRIHPVCILLVELELWPNLLHAAERRGVPVAVVNGRISRRSFRGYNLVRRLLPQLDRIDVFCVQNRTYGERLQSLGVRSDAIFTTGNLKYDCLPVRSEGVVRDPELVGLLDLQPEDPVVVGGSTHDPEEELLAESVLRLERDLGRPIRLVVAPRHPHRTASVLEAMQRVLQRERGSGHSVLRLTEQRLGGKGTSRAPWLVVDTIGELEKVYSLADVVFVGGTLARHGGHNMMEPAALGKPTVFGPHVWNFQLDVDLLLAGGGGILVEDPAGLRRELGALLADPAKCRTLVTRAKQVILQNQGATRGTLERLGPLLDRQAAG